ncbi:restriction endonuclease subunit S [Tepidiphilus sp. HLB4]
MAGEWQIARIEEVAERVAMGPFGSSIKVETFVPEGVPVISGQHLHGFKLDETPGFNFITPEHAERLRNANVQRVDVIFTHAGNIGQVAYIPRTSAYERYVISQRQFYLRPDPRKVLPEFLVAYFRSPEGQHKLLANTSQVGVPSIAQPVTYLRSLEIPLPPIPEQRAIAHILGTLDDKIELNRKQNETLEAMARALFKAWFVDFEPVRAKMEGRWRRGETLPGLPAHLYDLFPDRLVDSELGEIPEGWTITPVLDVFDLQGGSQPPAKEFISEPREGYVRLLQIRDFSSDAHLTFVPETKKLRFAEEDDILIGRYGSASGDKKKDSLGRICRGLSGAYNVALMKLEPKLAGREFCLQVVDDERFYQYLQGISSKAVQSGFSKRELAQYRIAMPSGELSAEYEKFGLNIYLKQKQQLRESRNLAQIRDTLLPKLISGELRIADAEKPMEKFSQ